MYVYDGTWHNINSLSQIDYSASLAVGIVECYGKSDQLQPDALSLFPNPSGQFINVNVPSTFVIEGVDCYDMSGRKQVISFQPSETAKRVYFNLAPGVYILVVKGSGGQLSSKFIVAGQF